MYIITVSTEIESKKLCNEILMFHLYNSKKSDMYYCIYRQQEQLNTTLIAYSLNSRRNCAQLS